MTWTTYTEAARITRVRPGTIRVWVARGRVASTRKGRATLVSLDDVRHAERAWRHRVAPQGQTCNTAAQQSPAHTEVA